MAYIYIKVFRKLQDAISTTNFPTVYFKPRQFQVSNVY